MRSSKGGRRNRSAQQDDNLDENCESHRLSSVVALLVSSLTRTGDRSSSNNQMLGNGCHVPCGKMLSPHTLTHAHSYTPAHSHSHTAPCLREAARRPTLSSALIPRGHHTPDSPAHMGSGQETPTILRQCQPRLGPTGRQSPKPMATGSWPKGGACASVTQ